MVGTNTKENECIVVTYVLGILGASEMGNRDDTNGETKQSTTNH